MATDPGRLCANARAPECAAPSCAPRYPHLARITWEGSVMSGAWPPTICTRTATRMKRRPTDVWQALPRPHPPTRQQPLGFAWLPLGGLQKMRADVAMFLPHDVSLINRGRIWKSSCARRLASKRFAAGGAGGMAHKSPGSAANRLIVRIWAQGRRCGKRPAIRAKHKGSMS